MCLPPNEPVIIMSDQDGLIELTRKDLLKYSTQANVIAAALMIRVSSFAFNLLSPQGPVERRKLFWRLGFPGPGILDCVELISHAVRESRCLQQPVYNHPDAPFSVDGQFLFEISYDNKTIVVWPDKDVFDDEFRTQVRTWQDELPSAERQAFLDYKAKKVEQIMTLPDDKLLHYTWKTTIT